MVERRELEVTTPDGRRTAAQGVLTHGTKFGQNLGKNLNVARFRLYRHRSSQVNTRFSGFFKIYQIIQLKILKFGNILQILQILQHLQIFC